MSFINFFKSSLYLNFSLLCDGDNFYGGVIFFICGHFVQIDLIYTLVLCPVITSTSMLSFCYSVKIALTLEKQTDFDRDEGWNGIL